MTQTLKKQLSLLCAAAFVGGALVWQSGAGRAQNETELSPLLRGTGPRKALARDEAAKVFAGFLSYLAIPDTPYSPTPDRISYGKMTSSISRRSFEQLKSKTETLLLAMATQWKEPSRTVRIQSESAQNEDAATATVVVEEAPSAARPLILIREKDAWGVDLIETYARWNDLQGAAKAAAIYRLTQIEIAGFELTPELQREREAVQRAACQSNLKRIGLAMSQYLADYDDRFSPAKAWRQVLRPYLSDDEKFTCPSLPKGQKWGYAFSSKLSQKFEAQVASTSQTVSLYETTTLKPNAYGLGENAAFRHQGGANYLFADGGVKWSDKSKIPSFKLGG